MRKRTISAEEKAFFKPALKPPTSAKVGTQPWIIRLEKGSKTEVGEKVRFKENGKELAPWIDGTITRVNPDGYLFIDLV